MTRRTDRLVLTFLVAVVCISFVNGQEKDPAAVKTHETSPGIFGRVFTVINPATKIFTEYINAMLIRQRGKKLPCTLYNPLKWDWECTDV